MRKAAGVVMAAVAAAAVMFGPAPAMAAEGDAPQATPLAKTAFRYSVYAEQADPNHFLVMRTKHSRAQVIDGYYASEYIYGRGTIAGGTLSVTYVYSGLPSEVSTWTVKGGSTIRIAGFKRLYGPSKGSKGVDKFLRSKGVTSASRMFKFASSNKWINYSS